MEARRRMMSIMCFNSRLREEATGGDECVQRAQAVSTHASVRRRQAPTASPSPCGRFNSRLREEATRTIRWRAESCWFQLTPP